MSRSLLVAIQKQQPVLRQDAFSRANQDHFRIRRNRATQHSRSRVTSVTLELKSENHIHKKLGSEEILRIAFGS